MEFLFDYLHLDVYWILLEFRQMWESDTRTNIVRIYVCVHISISVETMGENLVNYYDPKKGIRSWFRYSDQ